MSHVNSTGLHSLATLVKRLEAAASRFEDIAVVLDPSLTGNRVESGSSELSHHNGRETLRLDAPPPPPPPAPVPPPAAPAVTPAPAAVETPKSVIAYQEQVIDEKLKPFVELTKEFASVNVAETILLVQKQFDVLGDFLKVTAYCQKPEQKALEALLAPFPQSIEAISRAKEANRRDRDWYSHLTVVAEGAPVIGWVVNPKPVQAVVDIKDSVVYYGNKVKKEYKDKDIKHLKWVDSYVAVLDALQAYVKEYHTMGLVWNPKGVTVEQYKTSVSAKGAGGPPPPPPPAPPAPPKAPAAAAPAGGPAAVFAELNRGEDVTKGLRKVDKSEMTHKNPALRAGNVVPASPPSPLVGKKPIKPSKPQSLAGKKPPKFALEGNKWLIEFQENETLTVENVEISQSVNIFGCKGSTVLIKGKVNAVNIVNSKKTAVLVQSVVSSVSITSSPSFQLQITGSAPMIQLDSTDSGQIFLSKDSLNTEVTTAKCSAINISLPVEGEEDGVFDEQAVPEMFKTVVKNGKLVTTVVEHSG